jgi:hypothetical protein
MADSFDFTGMGGLTGIDPSVWSADPAILSYGQNTGFNDFADIGGLAGGTPINTGYLSSNMGPYYNSPNPYDSSQAGGGGGGSSGYGSLASMLGALGLGAYGASTGGGAKTATGGTGQTAGTQQTPLTPASQADVGSIQALLPYLYGQMNLNPNQTGVYNQWMKNVSSDPSYLMGGYDPNQWSKIIGSIPATQQANEAATTEALGRMAPYLTTYGPGQEGIIKQVAATDTGNRQMMTNALTQQAQAAQQGKGAAPGAFSSVMAGAGAPEQQQLSTTNNIMNALNNLIRIQQGGAPVNTQGTNAFQYTQPSLLSSLATGAGTGLTSPGGGQLMNSLFSALGITG